MFNVVPSGRSPAIGEDDLERLGYKLAIYPGALLGPVASAMAASLAGLAAGLPRSPPGRAGCSASWAW